MSPHPTRMPAPGTGEPGHEEELLFRLLDEWESLLRLLNRDSGSLDHLDALVDRRDTLGQDVARVVGVLQARWPRDHPRRRWLRGELDQRQARIAELELGLSTLLGSDLQDLRERLGAVDHSRRTLLGYGRRLRQSPRHLDTEQ